MINAVREDVIATQEARPVPQFSGDDDDDDMTELCKNSDELENAIIKALREKDAKQVAVTDYYNGQGSMGRKFQLPNGDFVSGFSRFWWSGGFENGPKIERSPDRSHEPF